MNRVLLLLIMTASVFADHAEAVPVTHERIKVGPGTFVPLFPESGNEELPPGAPAKEERPAAKPRKVEAFRMDRFPVTVKQYLAFVEANPRWRRSNVPGVFSDRTYLTGWKSELEPGLEPDSPATQVSWFAAKAYCEWTGGTLPTVEQWEFAAAAESQTFPGARDEVSRRILEWYGESTPERLPKVGGTFANKYGVWDLHGLVWEWTKDFNSALVTGESRGDSSLERGMYCGSGAAGASDFRDYAGFMRFAYRSSLQASYTARNLGFRCVEPMKGNKQ